MAVTVAMPRLGMTMREGTVVEWLARPGEAVTRGAPLLRIESEKAEVEIESPADGVLRHVWVPAGSTVPCGTLLAAITATADDPFDPEAVRREHAAPAPPPAAEAGRTGSAAAAGTARGRERAAATPRARRRARELGIDIAAVPGSGPGGRVTEADVEAFAARPKERVEVEPGVALEVPATGAGEPVVLLPGFGTDISVFAPQVMALGQQFRLLGIHPRGTAGSAAPGEAPLDIERDAADAAAVIGATGSAPAHLVGASLGAAVALTVALRHPHAVRSLVLITPFHQASPRSLAVLEAWPAVAEAAGSAVLARVLLPWFFATGTLADDAARERLARGLAAALARTPATVLRRRVAGLRGWKGWAARDLAAVRVPVLVLTGTEDLLVGDAAALAEAIPGARHVRIEGAGHAVTVEAPGPVTQALLGHLRSA